MADLNRRQTQILERIRQTGYGAIESLAGHFAVTAQTIRRDINSLCEAGLLQRYHGGAGLPSSVENLSYDTRQILAREEKRRIGQAAAAEIPDQASLMINIGTTTEAVAKALLDHDGLRVVTNNLNVANILRSNPSFEVNVTGGLVRNRDGGIVGANAVDMMSHFKVDIAVIGTSGIDTDGTLLDFDAREVQIARTIIENARRVFLVADHSKFGRSAMVRLAQMRQIDRLFTDRPPPRAFEAMLRAAAVEVHIAAPENGRVVTLQP